LRRRGPCGPASRDAPHTASRRTSRRLTNGRQARRLRLTAHDPPISVSAGERQADRRPTALPPPPMWHQPETPLAAGRHPNAGRAFLHARHTAAIVGGRTFAVQIGTRMLRQFLSGRWPGPGRPLLDPPRLEPGRARRGLEHQVIVGLRKARATVDDVSRARSVRHHIPSRAEMPRRITSIILTACGRSVEDIGVSGVGASLSRRATVGTSDVSQPAVES